MELKDIVIRTSAYLKESEDINNSCHTATLQELIDASPIKGGQYVRVCEHGVSYVSSSGIYIKLPGRKTIIDRFDLPDEECLDVYEKLGKTIVNLHVSNDYNTVEIDI